MAFLERYDGRGWTLVMALGASAVVTLIGAIALFDWDGGLGIKKIDLGPEIDGTIR